MLTLQTIILRLDIILCFINGHIVIMLLFQWFGLIVLKRNPVMVPNVDNDGNDIIVMNCVTLTLARCVLSVKYCSVKL